MEKIIFKPNRKIIINAISVADRDMIFCHAPEGYDWAAKSSSQFWWAFNERPYICTVNPITGSSDDKGFWAVFYNDPSKFREGSIEHIYTKFNAPIIGKPIGCFMGVNIWWFDSLISRPTNEELKTLYK